MDAAFVDASPAIRLALLGACVALLPLAWTAWRVRQERGRARWLPALTLTTLILTFDLVLFGSFTRLTDSGLGCPDWPGCYGHATPLGAKSKIDAAAAAMPDGPVTHGKAWIEMIHRYFAMAVGALIVCMTALAWRRRRQAQASKGGEVENAWTRTGSGPVSPWWPTLTLAWVLVQGAFGALTVTMRLFPAIVTLHLLLGMGLLALLALQHAWHRTPSAAQRVVVDASGAAHPARVWILLFAALVAMQIALGGWVSTNYAVLACRDFPMCQSAWWPPMAFDEGFTLWRPLGRGQGDENLPFAALTAIHFTHRAAAAAVGLAAVVLAWRLSREPTLRRSVPTLLALLAWQIASGVSNVVLGWPIVAALAHVAGAAGLVVWCANTFVLAGATRATPEARAGLGAHGRAGTSAPATAGYVQPMRRT
jgi:heme a synthase